MKYIYYYGVGCQICNEVESVLEAWIPGQYVKIKHSKSHVPGKSVLHLPDGPAVVDDTVIPAVPALYDKAANSLFVGDRAIYENLGVDGEA
jgi:hypothetical protein